MLSYLYIIEHIAFADKFITSKNTDFTRFFKIKRRHTGRLKTDLGGKNPQWEPWSHAAKRLLQLLELQDLK